MKAFASEIYAAVESGKLAEPFDAAMAKKACPGWADGTYRNFFRKHSVGNGEETELFIKKERGWYCLNQLEKS
jgi:hypothetical protein